MVEKLKAPRGTQDILAPDSGLWQQIESTAIEIFSKAGFNEIRTPIFESTDVFNRAVGQDSDIVNKEMYTFSDRSDRSLTLRPEATASVVRAFIENNLDREGRPQKLWYRGPMFRYERPQTGRYRQFHQIGIEALGAKAPYIDLEIIGLARDMLESLGIKDLTLYINSLGNKESRKNYTTALKDFLASLQDKVCEDCQRRFKQNPLRALDCKVEADQKLYANAPAITDFLDEESQEIWTKVQAGLKDLDINFVHDKKLVRGLDYYSHCVFEFKTNSKTLGAQSTVLAGGRYDSLVSTLGGAETAAVGWALGIERLSLLVKEVQEEKEEKKLFIISDSAAEALKLARKLRADLKDFSVDFDYEEAKFKKQFDKALKKNYSHIVFYMEDERSKGLYKIKNLRTQEEKDGLNLDELTHLCSNKLASLS